MWSRNWSIRCNRAVMILSPCLIAKRTISLEIPSHSWKFAPLDRFWRFLFSAACNHLVNGIGQYWGNPLPGFHTSVTSTAPMVGNRICLYSFLYSYLSIIQIYLYGHSHMIHFNAFLIKLACKKLTMNLWFAFNTLTVKIKTLRC